MIPTAWFLHDSTTAALVRRFLGRRQPAPFQDTMRTAYDEGLDRPEEPSVTDEWILDGYTWLLIGAGIGFLVLFVAHFGARAAQAAIFLPSLRAARMRRRDQEAAQTRSVWSYTQCPVAFGFFIYVGAAVAVLAALLYVAMVAWK